MQARCRVLLHHKLQLPGRATGFLACRFAGAREVTLRAIRFQGARGRAHADFSRGRLSVVFLAAFRVLLAADLRVGDFPSARLFFSISIRSSTLASGSPGSCISSVTSLPLDLALMMRIRLAR